MPHYFDEQQGGKFEPFLIPIHLKDMAIKLYSASGVFSIKHLDKGTETLLTYCDVPETGRVLDLGCGYGVVGVVVKLRHPELDVIQSDVNERALKLARKNCEYHKIKNVVVKSDVYDNLHDPVDVILVNPPYVAGRKLIFRMIEEAKDHLNKGGSLQLVARHQKGGKTLAAKMEDVFGNVDVLGKKAGFRVYCSRLISDRNIS